jgi:hypothetical protein
MSADGLGHVGRRNLLGCMLALALVPDMDRTQNSRSMPVFARSVRAAVRRFPWQIPRVALLRVGRMFLLLTYVNCRRPGEAQC